MWYPVFHHIFKREINFLHKNTLKRYDEFLFKGRLWLLILLEYVMKCWNSDIVLWLLCSRNGCYAEEMVDMDQDR
jgi:hypothetical protein